MKKLLITLALLLVSTALTGIATADQAQAGVSLDDLTALANYAPEDAPFFAAIRTDDAFINELDLLLAGAIDKLPEDAGVPPTFTVRSLLDTAVSEGSDGEVNFSADVRPWLGNSAAVFVPSLDAMMGGDDLPVVIAIAITDQERANAFVANRLDYRLEDGWYQVIEREDGSVLYQSEYSFDPAVLVTGDVLFAGTFGDSVEDAIVLPGADRVRLGITGKFRDTLAALPEESYNAVAYLDLTGAIEMVAPMLTAQMPPALADWFDPASMSDAIGQQAAGFTVLQDRSLVMDVVHTGTMGDAPAGPINLDFLSHVPADTALLMQGNGFGDRVRRLMGKLDQLDALLEELGAYPLENAGPFSNLRLRHLGTFARLSFEGTLGLDFDTTLEWLNGDHALFLSLHPGSAPMFGFDPGFRLGYGLVVATDNPGETASFVGAIGDMAAEMFATAREENGLFIVPLGDLISQPELANIAIGSNDQVLAAGTRASVNFALNPGDTSVATMPTFQFERGVFLPDTGVLLYADLAPLRAAFEGYMQANPDHVAPEKARNLRLLLSFFDTASITAVSGENGGQIRFSLTLGE